MKPWATQEMLSFLFANIAEEVMTKSETLFPHYDCPTACNFTAAAFDDGSAASVPPPMLDAAAAANDDERLRRSGRRRPLGAVVKDDDHWGDGAGGGADGGAVEPGMATAAAGGAAGTEGEEFAACHCVSTINDTATLSDHETFKYIADAIAKVRARSATARRGRVAPESGGEAKTTRAEQSSPTSRGRGRATTTATRRRRFVRRSRWFFSSHRRRGRAAGARPVTVAAPHRTLPPPFPSDRRCHDRRRSRAGTKGRASSSQTRTRATRPRTGTRPGSTSRT